MAEIFVISPTFSDEEIQKNIDQSTRFVIVPDQFNMNQTGWPNTWEWCNGKQTFIEKMVHDFPNCMFIFDRKVWFEADNITWFPMWWFDCVMNEGYRKIDVDWTTKRKFTSNFISGPYRISRVLTNFWLAKNYKIDQLIYTNPKNNNDMKPIKDVLMSSKHLGVTHINPNINLKEIWLDLPQDVRSVNDGEFLNHLYHQFHAQSYLSILSACNGIELTTTISEKVYRSLVSGNFSLHLGNHKVHSVLKNMGFEVFDTLFDFENLKSVDRYWMTIGVLESNKKIINDHEMIENKWFEQQDALKHNQKLCMDKNHWLSVFDKEISMMKSLCLTAGFPKWAGQLSWIENSI